MPSDDALNALEQACQADWSARNGPGLDGRSMFREVLALLLVPVSEQQTTMQRWLDRQRAVAQQQLADLDARLAAERASQTDHLTTVLDAIEETQSVLDALPDSEAP